MYATTNDSAPQSTVSLVSASAPDPKTVRRTLDAVYRERAAKLLEIARVCVRDDANARDAVQDAFVHVLERLPRDTSKGALVRALEAAVRVACERQRRGRRDEAAMKIELRKRFPV